MKLFNELEKIGIATNIEIIRNNTKYDSRNIAEVFCAKMFKYTTKKINNMFEKNNGTITVMVTDNDYRLNVTFKRVLL